MSNSSLRERLIALIEPVVARLGYELVELEYTSGRSHATLRLFIDRPPGAAEGAAANVASPPDRPLHAGVGLDDCERVSHEVSALLDVEDPIPLGYTLEVSSPGFDRVLRTKAHFERFAGSRVNVELKTAREGGRRRYTGKLESVDDAGIVLEVDREKVQLPFDEIGKARLQP